MDDLGDDCNSHCDSWSNAFTSWEQECINEVETKPDMEAQLENEKVGTAQKLWISFQNAACCVAQLYKDRQQEVSLWLPFQNAAGSITSLYKECLESQKKFGDLGLQCGAQRRNKELLAWVKKRKRVIRREDLLAFLSGKSTTNYSHHYHHPHLRSWSSPRQRLSLSDASASSTHGVTLTRLTIADPPSADGTGTEDEGDLQTFREALAVSVGIRNPANTGPSRRNAPPRFNNGSYAELDAFITEEFNRHAESRKRTASSNDVIMDSPTHNKRSKLL